MRVRYHHDRIGVNSRLDTVQAAILRVKLKYLDSYNEARMAAAQLYDTRLKVCANLVIPSRATWSNHIFHQYTLRVNEANREELSKFLAGKGIPSMVYYPIPLHSQKAFEAYRLQNSNSTFPVSNSLSTSVLSIPMHTELDVDTINFITESILSFFK
jgi:dTDP-4-amino-4,6-dideoxygalactose transaminase